MIHKNSLKTLLQDFVGPLARFAVITFMTVYRNIITLIKAYLSFFEEHAQDLFFFCFCKFETISDEILWDV